MNVVVIGESCIDKFVYCKTNRICPEAPVPVINPINTVSNPGMASNTIANVKKLYPDAEVNLITQNENIIKTRFVEKKSNQMFVRLDEGEDIIDPLKWNQELVEQIHNADIVIVSDYNKGLLSNKDILMIGDISKLSILDSKRKLNNEMILHFHFIKLNEYEFENNRHLNHKGIITTLGSKGAMYKGTLYPSPKPQETIDVSGAGDTFTASFITKYFETKSDHKSIKFANKMASKVVSKRGVVTP